MNATFNMGTLIDPKKAITHGQDNLFLTLQDLRTHFLISGSTGSGKSRSATKLGLDAIDQNVGIAVIDMHGDTVDDIAAHVVKKVVDTKDVSLLARTHYLQWTPAYVPRLDAFHFNPPPGLHPELRQNFEIAARDALVDRFASHVQSSTQGTESFDALPRLRRMLRAGLMPCAVRAPRLRLPTPLATIILNIAHPRHAALYGRIRPYLPSAVQADFALLHALDNPVKALEQAESALNRLSAFFSPLLAESFGETSDMAPVVDFANIIRRRQLLLVNLRETMYFSHLQGVTMGRMIATTLIDTILCLRREQRPDGFIVLLEEAGELLHEPFLRYLGAVRKYGAIVGICGQDLSTFGPLVPKLLSQAGVLITYNQRFPDDAKLLSSRIFRCDWTPLLHEVEREGPIEWLQLEDTSASHQTTASKVITNGTSNGTGLTESEAEAYAKQAGWQKGTTTQEAQADGHSTGATDTDTATTGTRQSPIMNNGKIEGMLSLLAQSAAKARGHNEENSKTRTFSAGQQQGESGSETVTRERGRGRSKSQEKSRSLAEGEATADGTSVTKRWVHIPHKVREVQETGQTKAGPSGEQLKRFQEIISWLPARTAIVNVLTNDPVMIWSADMPDAFASAAATAKSVEWLKQQLLRIHDYLVVPNLDPHEEEERIKRFLAQEQTPAADRPIIVQAGEHEGNGRSPLSI